MRLRVFMMAGLLALSQPWARGAEPPDPKLLTVERIFGQGDLHAEGFDARWLAGGTGYVTLEPSTDTAGGRDLVRHDPASGKTEILVPAGLLVPSGADGPLDIDDYAFSPDLSRLLVYTNSKRVWRVHSRGDYWVLDRTSRELRKLGGDAPPASLRHAKFAPKGARVAYARGNDLYVEDLDSHKITQLTHSTSPDLINGGFDWVYEEEFGLLDGFRFSPDGSRIAYWQLDSQGESEFPLVNETDSLYPHIKMIKYPKAGEKNAACRVGVVPVLGGATTWLGSPENLRDFYIPSMNYDSAGVVMQVLNRAQNTLQLVAAVPDSGTPRVILTERDPAWVDVVDRIHWVHKGAEFFWPSERDGWRRLYLVSGDGGRRNPITPDRVDAIDLVHVDEPRDLVYYTASPDNPTQAYLYRVDFHGTNPARVTPAGQPGTHHYDVSPDGRHAIHRLSRFDQPPTVELVELPSHKRVRTLVDNQALKSKLAGLKPWKTEFFRVDIGGGVALDAWCMRPADLDPKGKYPLLVHVYGEPAAQTVVDRWGGSGYLWHAMLVQRGYVVVSIDNRGTPAPRGRDWRKQVYRKIGILAPQDQAAAVRAIQKARPYLDPDRVGVWGWSGGGSMSLNAIFKFPDLYKVAVAIAPVANQRLYDTIYQERYMGLPSENPEGFTQGSAINFAHQFKGKLLLIHGTGDDNCHYQGTEALINELIRHGKPFSMMAYPNRSHAISEGRNTTLHLRRLMTDYLLENLPPGPRPGASAAKVAAQGTN